MPNGHTYARLDGFSPVLQRQQGHQVLMYSFLDSAEYVMYDFSRSIGDTVGSYVDIDTFDVVLVNSAVGTVFGQPRRSWSFRHLARQLIDVDTYKTIADSIGVCQFDGFIGPYSLAGAVILGKTYGTIVGVPQEESPHPSTFHLYQNYPNPFNPVTTIRYDLPRQAYVSLRVFNLLGQEVAVLVDEVQTAGHKSVDINATGLSSGVYLYRMRIDGFSETRKMLLMR
jgi:hypothetical protein